MGSMNLDRLLFDPADAANGPNVGAYMRAGSDGDLITSTLVSGKEGLDVNVISGINVEVDLSHTDDSVQIGDGTEILLINADGSLNAVVSATDLDIRNLVFATDKADVSGSVVALDAGTLAALENITVSASDLDIRDLVFATDKVDVSGSVITAAISAPNGTVLASAVLAANTATLLPASALANRKRMFIQNNGDKPVFLGGSGVTSATGSELSKGGTWSEEIGPSAAIYAITASGTCDLRVLEIS